MPALATFLAWESTVEGWGFPARRGHWCLRTWPRRLTPRPHGWLRRSMGSPGAFFAVANRVRALRTASSHALASARLRWATTLGFLRLQSCQRVPPPGEYGKRWMSLIVSFRLRCGKSSVRPQSAGPRSRLDRGGAFLEKTSDGRSSLFGMAAAIVGSTEKWARSAKVPCRSAIMWTLRGSGMRGHRQNRASGKGCAYGCIGRCSILRYTFSMNKNRRRYTISP